MSRSSLLGLSIVVSCMLHGGLLLMAPNIRLLQPVGPPQALLKTFRVDLSDRVPPPEEPPKYDPSGLASGPGSIEDLLARATEELKSSESRELVPSEVPMLEERLASDRVEREHDLEADPQRFAAVDTKILEISQETARDEVKVARRLVRPSTDHILAGDLLPTVRGELDLDREEFLRVPALGSGSGGTGGEGEGEGGDEGGKGTGAPPPPREGEILMAATPKMVSLEPPVSKIAPGPQAPGTGEEEGYEFFDDMVDIQLSTYVPPGEKEGYFRLTIGPKEGESIEPLPKDVTFVVDASNSIVQRKLDRTVAGLTDVIEELRPQDRFNVVVFRDTPTSLGPDLVFATEENKEAARQFLRGVESRGKTDVYEGIRPVVEASTREGIPGPIVLATDGRPTAGIRDGRTIINALTDENNSRRPIYAFGGGDTVNRYLLDLLAYRNRGESHVEPRIDEMDNGLKTFFHQFEDPVLVDCRADYGRIDTNDVFPKELPDFYKERSVTVYGRYSPEKDREFVMRLVGKAGARRKELVFKEDLSKASAGGEDIARDWAFRRIYYLIGEICRVGDRPELVAELRALSEKYDIHRDAISKYDVNGQG